MDLPGDSAQKANKKAAASMDPATCDAIADDLMVLGPVSNCCHGDMPPALFENAHEAQQERIAQGYDAKGQVGGPYTECQPPPGFRFGGYLKGASGICWRPLPVTDEEGAARQATDVVQRADKEISQMAPTTGGEIGQASMQSCSSSEGAVGYFRRA
eukprot:9502731-Pyramimonas_sp.AAC.1